MATSDTPVASRNLQKEPSPPVNIQNARVANAAIPILNLPAELLGEISLLAILEYIREDEGYRNSTALTFAAVCHHWRAVALAQPQLWAQVPLSGMLHRTRLFLARSRSALLTLHMFRLDAHGRSCVKEWYQGLAALLREPSVSTRVQMVLFRNQQCSSHGRRYSSSDVDCVMISRYLLPLLNDVDFPSLCHAILLEEPDPLSGEPDGGTDIEPAFFNRCSGLRTLRLLCCRLRIPQAYSALPALRRLEIVGQSPSVHYEDMLAVLKMIPQLGALHVGCMESDEDFDFEWTPDPDTTHFLPSGELVPLPNLYEIRVQSEATTIIAFLSRLSYSSNARVHVEASLGIDDEDEEGEGYRAIIQHLLPLDYAKQNALPNFVLSLGAESVAISSLMEECPELSELDASAKELDARRTALMDIVRRRKLWEYKTSATKPSPSVLQLGDHHHHPPRHFTLSMLVDWEQTPFVQNVIGSEIPNVSNLRLVVQTEHREGDESSSEYESDPYDYDFDPDYRAWKAAKKNKWRKRNAKWGAIGDTLLPKSWGPVEYLQIEEYAIPGFVKALLAMPDDPASVLPIIRDLRALDIRGVRHLDSPHTELMEGLQRRTKVLGRLDHLCMEDPDVWRGEPDPSHVFEFYVEDLEPLVQPGGLRIRTLHDALMEQELDWEASAEYPKPRHSSWKKW
ncbi:unnamed protein product [Peniophora sp. CBMAI 1063]|nr:unnamed protein product [Peniophora sp. CBMAI 1063]